MNDPTELASLKGDLSKTLEKIDAIERFYQEFKCDAVLLPAGKSYDLIVLADVLVDFYTCLETGFVRISKFFENQLDPSRWHSHLIEKMTVDVAEVRPRLLGDRTYALLLELMKFRHFKRYYFAVAYDRDRMEYLEKKFNEALPLVRADLLAFINALDRLAGE